MRLLVLDESRVLSWVVEHLSPPGVEVEYVESFEEAKRRVRERPPDAAVVSLTPAHLPWNSFQHLCASSVPPVPVLYESCVHKSPSDAGLGPLEGYAEFLPKPTPRGELQAAIQRLIEASRRLGRGPSL